MGESKGQKPMSKDELISQLQQQNRYLMVELRKQNEEGFYKRLDYLFKVVEHAKLFVEVDKDFVLKTVAEIVDTITIEVPEEVGTYAEASETKECTPESGCVCVPEKAE